jgi:hypothetical protein
MHLSGLRTPGTEPIAKANLYAISNAKPSVSLRGARRKERKHRRCRST